MGTLAKTSKADPKRGNLPLLCAIQCPHWHVRLCLSRVYWISPSLVKIDSVRKHAMSLEAVTEEPHHDYSSFRVRGKIFVTVPPDETRIHVFVGQEDRDQASTLYPGFVEPLLWGGKVVGLRVLLKSATASAVKSLISKAYQARVLKDAGPKRSGKLAARAKP